MSFPAYLHVFSKVATQTSLNDAIYAVAKDTSVFRHQLASNVLRIRLNIKIYREYQTHLNNMPQELHKVNGKLDVTPLYDRLSLIQSLHDVGFLSAVVLIAWTHLTCPPPPKKALCLLQLGPCCKAVRQVQRQQSSHVINGSSLAKHILHLAALNNQKRGGQRNKNTCKSGYPQLLYQQM